LQPAIFFFIVGTGNASRVMQSQQGAVGPCPNFISNRDKPSTGVCSCLEKESVVKVQFLLPAIMSLVALGAYQADSAEVVVTSPESGAAVIPPVPAASPTVVVPRTDTVVTDRPDGWRYKFENNHWWYWTADKRWMWYSEPGGWTYYTPSGPYTTGYGGVAVTPAYSTPVYAEPVYAAPAPTYYSAGYGYYPGYYGGYSYGGPGVYVGVRGVGVGIGFGRGRR
jgi:hypothetical protein